MTAATTLGEVRPEHERDGQPSELVQLHYVRGYAVPIVEVWELLTEPAGVAQWFGTMTGDPLSRHVQITTADDCTSDTADVDVTACTSPHLLDVTIAGAMVDVRLNQIGVVTTLEVTHRHLRREKVSEVGPYWQYYLDRLDAAIGGDPMPVWADYRQLGAEYRCPG
ncbi:MAG: SRPBCC domain-containing protein [Aldersonia sp.]|nr:SRPBCC domain-containing protein [Aldersonia sp.]